MGSDGGLTGFEPDRGLFLGPAPKTTLEDSALQFIAVGVACQDEWTRIMSTSGALQRILPVGKENEDSIHVSPKRMNSFNERPHTTHFDALPPTPFVWLL